MGVLLMSICACSYHFYKRPHYNIFWNEDHIPSTAVLDGGVARSFKYMYVCVRTLSFMQ